VTAPSLIGTTLGGYEVQALLGSGGMATVYRGLDGDLQRPVAIKVLAPHAAALPGFTERFRQEARLVANLRHPNIVQVYAFGEERGLTYMVQELLPGPTLEEYMADAAQQGRRLSQDEITQIISQLAAALDAAHAAGVIHRDVKPANALWNADGALALTDFGIAKDTIAAISQTQTGMVMGTPAYMAPEQGQGFPLSPASDVYALGVVLYEMLAGKVPFVGSTPQAVVLQHIQNPPPSLGGIRPNLPPAIETVVQRALAKDPQARFASAGALAAALQQAWASPLSVSVHEQPTRVWVPPAGAGYAAPAAPTTPTAILVGQGQPAPLAAPPMAPPMAVPRRTAHLLPILGALLLLAFLVGGGLALRGDPTVIMLPSVVVVHATPLPTAEAETSAAVPTADAPVTPIGQVRALLASADAGPESSALLGVLVQVQQSIDQSDPAGATTHLAELQRNLLAAARAGTLRPALLRQALSGIDAIADEHGLSLPLTVSAD